MHVVVGRIVRAHGVRGEVAVDIRTDDPGARFAPGIRLLTRPVSAGPLVVTAVRPHGERLLVSFAGILDRERAEELRGVRLVVDVSTDEPPADPDEFFDHQLEGLQAQSPAGELLGTVTQVLHHPAQDLLALRRPDGSEALVPFVTQIVPDVDVAGGRLVIDAPPGLLNTEGVEEAR